MAAVLYVVPASHPCATVERALALKGIAYRRVDLPPVAHAAVQLARFGRSTVPGLVLEDGEKLVGSTAILRRLDELVREPVLLPDDAELLRAEEWGDQVLQPIGRRLIWASLRRRPDALSSYSEGADLPVPARLAALGGGVVAAIAARRNRAGDAEVRADLVNLGFHLDRIERWIAAGVLGGAVPNGADLQIASGLRLLLTIGDVAPFIEGRPAEALARAQFPQYPGRVPPGALPEPWLAAARAAV